MQRCLAALTAVLVAGSGCAADGGPPRGRALDAFLAFAPRPMGQIGQGDDNARWVGDVSSAETEAATRFDGRDPEATGPLRAGFSQRALVNEGRGGTFLARFDGALCPDAIGPAMEELAPGRALTVEEKTGSGWRTLDGETHWRSDRLIAFESAAPWRLATKYRVTGPERPCDGAEVLEAATATGAQGEPRWVEELVYSPLEASFAGIDGARLPANDAVQLTLTHPVPIERVREAVTALAGPRGFAPSTSPVDAGEGVMVAVEIEPVRRGGVAGEQAPTTFEIRPARAEGTWPAGKDVVFRVAGTLVSPAGPEPLGVPVAAVRGIASSLTITPSCTEDCDPGAALRFDLNRPLHDPPGKARGALDRVKVTPRPRGLGRSQHGRSASQADQIRAELVFEGAFVPGETYRFTFPKGLRDDEGGALAEAVTAEVTFGRSAPALYIDDADWEAERYYGWPPFARYDDDGDANTPAWNQDWYEPGGAYWDVMVLDASLPMTLGVFGRRIESYEVRVAAIAPERMPTWLGANDSDALEWPRVDEVARETRTMRQRGRTEWDSQAVDLGRLAGDRRGPFVVDIEAKSVAGPGYEDFADRDRRLVMLTDLDVTAAASETRTTVRVQTLAGRRPAPVANARVRLVVPNRATAKPRTIITELGKTDDAGVLEARSDGVPADTSGYLVVDAPDGDRAVLQLSRLAHAPPDDALTKLGESVTGILETERGIYRPGETVHLLGWTLIDTPWHPLRVRDMPEGTTVRITMSHPRIGELAFKDVKTGPHGKFTADFELPDALMAGTLSFDANVPGEPGGGMRARAKAEDFRTPTFWVRTRAISDDDPRAATARVKARATAYSGGPVPVVGHGYSHSCQYHRPSPHDYGLDYGWSVGIDHAGDASGSLEVMPAIDPSLSQPARDGEVRYDLRFGAVPPATRLSCELSVSLTDPTLQAYGDDAWVYRVGDGDVVALRVEDDWAREGAHEVLLRGVAPGGARVALEDVKVQLYRRDYGETVRTPVEDVGCTLDVPVRGDAETGDANDVRCDLRGRLESGGYELEAITSDGIVTRRSLYVRWQDEAPPRAPGDEQPEAKEVCERAADGQSCRYVTPQLGFFAKARPTQLSVHPEVDYVSVGQPLRIAVRGPWSGAEGILLIGEGGHLGRYPFKLRGTRAELTVPVDERWVGDVSFYAWLPRKGKDGLPRLEAANASVQVSTASRTLAISLDMPKKARAGDELPVRVAVTDRDDTPAHRGRVSLWMVDEAVIDLTNYRAPHLDRLNPDPESSSDTLTFVHDVMPPFVPRRSDPGAGLGLSGIGSGGGGGSGYGAGYGGVGKAARQQQRVVRDRFATTPLFLADVALDAQGKAETTVRLPGNLTTFRLFAVATDALPRAQGVEERNPAPTRFGTSRRDVTVDLPVSVRLVLPRHLRPGDRAVLGAIVVNRGDEPLDAQLALRVEGDAVTVRDATGDAGDEPGVVHPVHVDPDGQLRVDFPASTLDLDQGGVEGEVTVEAELRATDGHHLDGEARPLTVAHERLRDQHDAFAGKLAAPHRSGASRTIRAPVKLPDHVDATAVGVQVELSTTRLVELGPTLASLGSYPYGCTEQTASSMLPAVAASGARLGELYPDVVAPAFVDAAIDKLMARQHENGGFGYWSGDGYVSPWASIYATWVLHLASERGYAVPEAVLDKALDYVRQEAHREPEPPEWPWERERRRYAAWVLADTGHIDERSATVLRTQAEEVLGDDDASIDERALAAYALARAGLAPDRVDALLDLVRRDLTFSNGQAFVHPEHFDVSLGDNFRSTVRSTAFVLLAELEAHGDDPINDALAAGLLRQRFAGDWGSTQSNAFALVALDRWAERRESSEPKLRTRVWIEERPLFDDRLEGPSVTIARASGPLSIADEDRRRRGARRSRGAPEITLDVAGEGAAYFQVRLDRMRARDEQPEDRGLHVEATLRDAAGPVAAQAEPGALLALDIQVTADTATRWVVADVPLPAGLEVVRTDLANQAGAMPIHGERGDWVSHQELGMDRVVIYGDDLSPGAHRTTVFVRASTPGRYGWPGARAQAMYAPGVVGWSQSAEFVVRAP